MNDSHVTQRSFAQRIQSMRHLTLTTLLSGLLSLTATAAPNIIYILLDDAGYGDFSCYAQKKFSIPNIDRLAAEGMRFTDHYSGSTVCAPTRSVRWPGKIVPGTTTKHISAHWDVFPTVCELAGTPIPERLDGISFLPTLAGKEQKKHDYLYWKFHKQGGKRAVRFGQDGQWKAVQLNLNKKAQKAPIELYDILKDPAEKNNLADKNKDLVAKAVSLFEEAHTENDNFKFKWER